MPKCIYNPGVLSILVPVYNERTYLSKCIERVLAVELPRNLSREIIMVDDASTDGTSDIVRELAAGHPGVIRAFYQEKNQGKGAAIRRAVEEMTGEIAIIQDADLEYDPSEYPLLLEPILEGVADVVYGSRFTTRTMRRVLNYHHKLGNIFLTFLSNATTGLDLTDMETCYKVFRADLLKTIPLRSNRFGFEPEITAKIAKRGCAVYEVPISYRGRGYAEGKKINWKDGFAAIGNILKYALIDDCYSECYGTAQLLQMTRSGSYNRTLVKLLAPYFGERILEIGAGIGNLSRFLPKKEKLIVTESDPEFLAVLQTAFKDNSRVDVVKLDLNDQNDFEALGPGACDTILAINVLEFLDDDMDALVRLRPLLKPGGKLLALVPQHADLFGPYDEQLGHRRRYSREGLEQALVKTGLAVERFENFNSLAMLGWGLRSKLAPNNKMTRNLLKLHDFLTPWLWRAERAFGFPGLSLLVVARAMPGSE
ncbi:MAG: glycosyltransferase [Desulfovibrionaceae bacterium]|nr:glycosyltransferase [Desulfovibrionaceae bacterium]MBF0512514.1 glycosyltransferase [Desulfovibrionaceae bacterium]